ncbi:type III secretion protein HrpD [Pseudomonas orientalis]|uniref:type III secretion protein n=1 Tax=Pseudomonas orientalis TaxID=76758 RepID=UPI000F55F0FF|nr:type III secretion protein [Pseudomonas orientalis]AZE82139.1 type III secretion protein HrpD [Pseudomonas orientalis]
MTPRLDEHLAWARWWAFPWESAHEDWKGNDYPALESLFRRGQSAPHTLTGYAACLPADPHTTVIRLALASREQLNLMLALVHDIFNPEDSALLTDSHHQWCKRLSKALPPAILPPGSDPLRLLHSWVEFATWQRLRLRFSRKSVVEVETANLALGVTGNRLDTLWQAVVWRATTLDSEDMPLAGRHEELSNAMPP